MYRVSWVATGGGGGGGGEELPEIASHTWRFFWHAAIIMHYDPQLSQGLTADEKRAPYARHRPNEGTRLVFEFFMGSNDFIAVNPSLRWHNMVFCLFLSVPIITSEI